MKILTSEEDNFIYDWLLDLLKQVKLVQGGTSLASTLRRHQSIKNYMIQKQKEKLDYIEHTFFTSDGNLDLLSIEDYHHKSLQKNQLNVY